MGRMAMVPDDVKVPLAAALEILELEKKNA
jgi:hypothetical protein